MCAAALAGCRSPEWVARHACRYPRYIPFPLGHSVVPPPPSSVPGATGFDGTCVCPYPQTCRDKAFLGQPGYWCENDQNIVRGHASCMRPSGSMPCAVQFQLGCLSPTCLGGCAVAHW